MKRYFCITKISLILFANYIQILKNRQFSQNSLSLLLFQILHIILFLKIINLHKNHLKRLYIIKKTIEMKTNVPNYLVGYYGPSYRYYHWPRYNN